MPQIRPFFTPKFRSKIRPFFHPKITHFFCLFLPSFSLPFLIHFSTPKTDFLCSVFGALFLGEIWARFQKKVLAFFGNSGGGRREERERGTRRTRGKVEVTRGVRGGRIIEGKRRFWEGEKFTSRKSEVTRRKQPEEYGGRCCSLSIRT